MQSFLGRCIILLPTKKSNNDPAKNACMGGKLIPQLENVWTYTERQLIPHIQVQTIPYNVYNLDNQFQAKQAYHSSAEEVVERWVGAGDHSVTAVSWS